MLNCERVDVNAPGTDGFTPLEFAISTENLDVLKVMLNCGRVDVNAPGKNGFTPLERAIATRKPEIVQTVLNCKRVDVNSPGEDGCTPFELALAIANTGNSEVLQVWLDCEMVDVNAPGKNGLRPVEMAIAERNLEALQALLGRKDLILDDKALSMAVGFNGETEIGALLEKELARRKELSASPKGELKVEDVD